MVSGKGGTGKTTVAAAMALALAREGQRVLLAEVEGRQGIAQVFDIPPLGLTEVRILADVGGGQLWGLSVDAKAALWEYLQTFYKLGRAGSALERLGAIDFATTIAPGVRDVLLIGKVYEAVGRTRGSKRGQGARVWDAVVLDAPPTGRIGRFLNVNAEVADVARVGPIRNQADSITRLLRSGSTAVHLVTLLEEMPVQETVDAVGEISTLGMPLGSIIVNMVREALLTEEELDTIATAQRTPSARDAVLSRITADLRGAGIGVSAGLPRQLLSEAIDHAERLELEAEQETLLAATGRPLRYLSYLPDGVEDGGLSTLAGQLSEPEQAP